jgi:hypothetical protein
VLPFAVAETVGVKVPVAARPVALIVNVDVAPGETGFGAKLALTPRGRPEMLRFTRAPAPELGVTLTVTLEPRVTVAEVGASERVNVSQTVTATLLE